MAFEADNVLIFWFITCLLECRVSFHNDIVSQISHFDFCAEVYCHCICSCLLAEILKVLYCIAFVVEAFAAAAFAAVVHFIYVASVASF